MRNSLWGCCNTANPPPPKSHFKTFSIWQNQPHAHQVDAMATPNVCNIGKHASSWPWWQKDKSGSTSYFFHNGTQSCHITTNDVIGCFVAKCTQIRRISQSVDQFGRMRPSAPYFSYLSLFAEGGTLVDMFWAPLSGRLWRPDSGPLIKNNPRGLPVQDGSAKQVVCLYSAPNDVICCDLAAPSMPLGRILFASSTSCLYL